MSTADDEPPASPTYFEAVAACASDRAPARNWPTTHTFFCDETGNTGSQFYSPDQPIYAEGGWLVPHSQRSKLEAAFVELEKNFGFTPKTKGTRLKDSARGRQCIAAVFDSIGKTATPFFYLVEKRYFICAKAVETYFDPKYNPAVDPIETFDPRIRKLRADLLYGAPETVVVSFAEAFRRDDARGIVSAGRQWADVLAQNRQVGLATELRIGLPTLGDHMQREFSRLRGAGLPRGYDSLNAPSLDQTLQLIERSSPPCELVHDQCDSMSGIYRYFFDRYRNAQHEVLRKIDGGGEIFGFRRLNSLTFGDSELEPLLRASDYLVASCVDFSRRALAGEPIPAELHSSASHGLGRMMRAAVGDDAEDDATARQVGELMAADSWIDRVAARFAQT